MQKIRVILGKAVRRSLVVLSLVCLLSFGSLGQPIAQPAYAAATTTDPQLAPSEKAEEMAGYPEETGSRERGYEEAKQDAENLKTEEDAYERNLQAYEERKPDTGLVEGAKGLIEKITGND